MKLVARYIPMVLGQLLLVYWKLVSRYKKMELAFQMLEKLLLDILTLATMMLESKLLVFGMLDAKYTNMELENQLLVSVLLEHQMLVFQLASRLLVSKNKNMEWAFRS